MIHLVTTSLFLANMFTLMFAYGAIRWTRRERNGTENEDGAGWDLAMMGVPLVVFAASAYLYFS